MNPDRVWRRWKFVHMSGYGLFWLRDHKRGGTLLPLLCWPPRYHWRCLKTWWYSSDRGKP